MKILYVKNNSERAEQFQLKTIIYQENGQKYVRKEALNKASIPHLKKMKENYSQLSDTIKNPQIKLAKIIDESKNSLTFEYIDGISLEKKYQDASLLGKESSLKVIETYIDILKNGFKTTKFDSVSMASDTYKNLFGEIDFNSLNGELCFDGLSNLDLIFSNIIFKDDQIYLIDYEWVYNVNVPINYILYRPLSMLYSQSSDFLDYFSINTSLFHAMERYFVDTYVMNDGFYFQKNNYLKKNSLITKQIEQLQSHVQGKEEHIQELSSHILRKDHEIKQLHAKLEKLSLQLHDIGEKLSYATSIVELRDKQLALKNEQIEFLNALTLKRRLKHQMKKIIPTALLKLMGFSAYAPLVMPTREFEEIPEPKREKPAVYRYTVPTLDKIETFPKEPLISIIMPVYNVDPQWLEKAITSVESQWYKNWELCIADDKSTNPETIAYLKNIQNPKIKITFLETNLNISGASNAALALATGEYIALLDNDDELTPDALYEVVKCINQTDADFIYSDEDFIDIEGECSNPHYKPDFSPDLLLSHNYITHFSCFRKTLLDKVGHFDSQFDGSQDYDLFLRLTEQTDNIQHIQKILYHWRTIEGSTSADSEAKPEAIERSKRVLENAMQRRGVEASIEYGNLNHFFRVKYTIIGQPLVSIIIPFKDKPELLDMCVNSILKTSTYAHYEIIGISNNSESKEVFELMETLEKKDSRVSFYEYNTEFNYADINNHAVNTYAKGEHVLLLNNDIEVIEPSWIEAMLEHSQREEIGCVGAKLYYPDDTIQHAGVIIGLGGYAGHSHKMYPRDNPGYFNRLNAIQNLSAVTAACLMIKKRIYQEIDGMDAVNFKVAYNDVDFCLRVMEEGYYNLFTPYAQMYHHESISRGYETTPEKIARFQTEKDALYKRHPYILENGDPYYNPNLTQDKEDFSLCLK